MIWVMNFNASGLRSTFFPVAQFLEPLTDVGGQCVRTSQVQRGDGADAVEEIDSRAQQNKRLIATLRNVGGGAPVCADYAGEKNGGVAL
jgi:hypothetical protein